jgi:F0F1-type ATP synthase assembly protein I
MDSGDSRGIGRYVNFALLLPVAAFVGYAMGYGLDTLFHIEWLRYAFLVLGVAAGFIEVIRELNRGT